jgi:lipopolysaccharide transport system permease protein
MVTPSKVPVSNPNPIKIHIEPSRGWVAIELRELWKYREMIYFLTWRDVKVRYKQTVLGATWAIIQPVFNMIIFSVIFGRLAQLDSEGIPYPIFNYAALLPWNYFSQSLSQSSNSIVGSAHLITKVYFPRLIIPLTSVVSGLVDFGISFFVMIILMLYFQVQPTIGLFLLPLFLLLSMITALGVGLWLSALNVQYRDVRYVVPFLIQFWMFATPVVYSSTLLQEPWRTLYGLNPMVGVVEGFRWALLGTEPPKLMILISTVVSVLLVISGIYYFRRMEKYFADLV